MMIVLMMKMMIMMMGMTIGDIATLKKMPKLAIMKNDDDIDNCSYINQTITYTYRARI